MRKSVAEKFGSKLVNFMNDIVFDLKRSNIVEKNYERIKPYGIIQGR